MSNNFRVGQKVVCVDDTIRAGTLGWYPGCAVVRGRIYTVRGIAPTALNGVPGLRLVEVVLFAGHPAALKKDAPYKASRFRPAVDKPASIEVFRKMLTPSDEGVNA